MLQHRTALGPDDFEAVPVSFCNYRLAVMKETGPDEFSYRKKMNEVTPMCC